MRCFSFNEYFEDEHGPNGRLVTLTEEELLDHYWTYWSGQMLKRGARSPRITEANCIDDFLVVYWGWEVTPGHA